MFLLVYSSTEAAPPLVTDDAGVVNRGGWEYILNVTGESRPAEDSMDMPGLEVSYGIYDSMQLTAAVARQVIEERAGSSRSSWGYGQIGYKWRFYADDARALAFAPAYFFPLNSSSRARGIIEDVRVLSLPLVATFATGAWEINAQTGLDITSTSTNGIGYGLATGYALTDTVTLLAEIYGEELSGDEIDEGITNWRAGFTWGFMPDFSLLAAWGGNIDSSDLPAEDTLDYDYFLGLQYNTP